MVKGLFQYLDQQHTFTLRQGADAGIPFRRHPRGELHRAVRLAGAPAVDLLGRRRLRWWVAAAGLATGATSGAVRFVLASSSVGGAPSSSRRPFSFLSLDTSAICHPVDERLNECVSPLVQARKAGFCDAVAGVLRLAVGRPVAQAPIQDGVAGLL